MHTTSGVLVTTEPMRGPCDNLSTVPSESRTHRSLGWTAARSNGKEGVSEMRQEEDKEGNKRMKMHNPIGK